MLEIQGSKSLAVFEHARKGLNFACIKRADVKISKFLAGREHGAHIYDLARIEVAEIESLKFGTVAEHVTHIRYVTGIKSAKIQSSDLFALPEHIFHGRNARRIKTRKVTGGHVCKILEHLSAVRIKVYLGGSRIPISSGTVTPHNGIAPVVCIDVIKSLGTIQCVASSESRYKAYIVTGNVVKDPVDAGTRLQSDLCCGTDGRNSRQKACYADG